MDKSSWAMIVFIFATMLFFIGGGIEFNLPAAGILPAVGFALLTTLALIAIMCIPVLLYCYIVKMIPDIDYSVRAAFALTIVGIISEFLF